MRTVFGSLRHTRTRTRITFLSIGLVILICLTSYIQVLLNNWNGPFYDSIEKRNLSEFGRQLEIFVLIAGALLVCNVVQAWLNQTATLLLRRGLAVDLLRLWNSCGRAVPQDATLEGARKPGPAYPGRFAQCRRLDRVALHRPLPVLNTIAQLCRHPLVYFRRLRRHDLRPHHFHSGYMVWIALIYAGAGTFLSSVVGRQLVDQNNRRAAFEAEFRKALVEANTARGTDTVTRQSVFATAGISTASSPMCSPPRGSSSSRRRTSPGSPLASAGGGLVVPVLAAAPAYFAGQLTFGGLMMAVGAFNQVNTALRWQITNFSMIAQWRAAMHRIVQFKLQLQAFRETTATTARADIRQLTLPRQACSPILNRSLKGRRDATDRIRQFLHPPARALLCAGSGGERVGTLHVRLQRTAGQGAWP